MMCHFKINDMYFNRFFNRFVSLIIIENILMIVAKNYNHNVHLMFKIHNAIFIIIKNA